MRNLNGYVRCRRKYLVQQHFGVLTSVHSICPDVNDDWHPVLVSGRKDGPDFVHMLRILEVHLRHAKMQLQSLKTSARTAIKFRNRIFFERIETAESDEAIR